MPTGPSPIFELQVVLKGIEGTVEELGRVTAEAWNDFLRAFPNPRKMLDVVINYFTGLPGLLVTIPFTGIQTIIMDILREAKLANRVMTVEKSISLAFEAHKEIIRNVTFTDNSGLLGLLAGWLGRFLYTWGKRFKLIYALLGASDLEAIIQVVLNSLKRKVGLLRIVLAIVAGIIAIVSIGFLFWVIGLMLVMMEGGLTSRILPQDSKRVRKSFRNRQVRVNTRPGPDS